MPRDPLPPEDLTDDRLLWHLPRSAFNRPMIGGIPILRKIGKGAMGAVYYAIDEGHEVAVKILPPSLVQEDPQLADRFVSEGKLAMSIQSDHVVKVFDVDKDHDTQYIVMEYVHGMTAKGYLKRVGRPGLTEGESLEIVIAATRGLAAAHRAGIIHRDIKPDNILIPDGRLAASKVADLGLAKPTWGGESVGTKTALLLGTPGFMAPEQAEDSKHAGPAADVFAMGATLQFLLTGLAPFGGDSIMVTVRNTIEKPPRPLPPALNPAVAAVITRCLEKQIPKRFMDGIELLAALEDAKKGVAPEHVLEIVETERIKPSATLDAPPAFPPPPAPPPEAEADAPPRRAWIAPVVIAIVALLGFGLWRLISHRQERDWLVPRDAAELAGARLDQPRRSLEWQLDLDVIKHAASFGRDSSLTKAVEICELRLREEEAFAAIEAASDLAEQLRLVIPFISAYRGGLREAAALALGAQARVAAEIEWQKASEEADGTRTTNYARAVATLRDFARRFDGTAFGPNAPELLKRWVEEDWQRTSAEAAAAHSREEFEEAIRLLTVFLALPHDGGNRREDAEKRIVMLKAEGVVAVDLAIELADPRWTEGLRRYRAGDYDGAIDAWIPLAGDARVAVCLKSALLNSVDVHLQAGVGRRQHAQMVLAACSKIAAAVPGWKRLASIRVRAEREDIPDDAREAFEKGSALARTANLDAEQWHQALTYFRRARPGLIPNRLWRDVIEKAVADCSARVLELVRKHVASATSMTGWEHDQVAVRAVWRAIGRGLTIDPNSAELLASQQKLQGVAAFAPVFRWEDLLRTLAETPSALGRLELLAAYKAKVASPPFPDEVKTLLAAADDEAWLELSRTSGELSERIAQAERYAVLASRGAALLDTLKRDRAFGEAMGRAASHVKAKAWKEAFMALEEALRQKPGDESASGALKAARESAQRDPRGWVEVRTLLGHSGAVRALAFAADGTLFSASEDRSVRQWEIADKPSRILAEHGKAVNALALAQKVIAAGGDDGLVRLSNGQTLKSGPVKALAVSPDGRFVACAVEKNINVYEVATGVQSRCLTGHTDTVTCLAFTPDGTSIASGSWDTTIRLWDVQSGNPLRTLAGHSKPVQSIAIRGSMLASAGRDETVVLWDLNERKELRKWSANVQSLDLSPDGSLVAGVAPSSVRIWDSASGGELKSWDQKGILWSVAFSHDARFLATAGMGGVIKIWGAKN